ncbi:hypothetical protein B4109_3061 [Geobacillus stearothermophilus]|uniref:Phage terminase large subunit C-terminal domain-containing protein n=2 Tax=Geobacillus stearothermophilus TaxID=1422 RepID=A0A150MUM0_GEOSE|nr:hypothetical protein B4109_3061 [Geobacillus stearothermophilus]
MVYSLCKYAERQGRKDVHDPTAFVALAVDQNEKKIYIFDELYQKGLSNQKIYERLAEKGYEKSTIIADSAEPKSIDELKRLGLRRIRGCSKGRDSVMHGIQFIQNYKIIIHPKCIHFIEEINNYVYAKDREGNTLNKPIDEFNHLMDAMRYAMEVFMEKRKARAVPSLY